MLLSTECNTSPAGIPQNVGVGLGWQVKAPTTKERALELMGGLDEKLLVLVSCDGQLILKLHTPCTDAPDVDSRGILSFLKTVHHPLLIPDDVITTIWSAK